MDRGTGDGRRGWGHSHRAAHQALADCCTRISTRKLAERHRKLTRGKGRMEEAGRSRLYLTDEQAARRMGRRSLSDQ